MKEIKTYGEIKNGAFYPRNSAYYMQSLKDAGTVSHCLLTIEGANVRSIPQNSYAWAVFSQIALRMNQDWEDIEPDDLYYNTQKKYCQTTKVNPETGQTIESVKKLKRQDPVRFFEIMEKVRMSAVQTYPDIHIDTPAEHYGITEQAYDLWKMNKINFAEAKKMSQ